METIMKTSHWITRLTACATVVLAAPLYADAGKTDGQGHLTNTYSTQSREKLRSEMDAAEQDSVSHGDTGMSHSLEAPIGARGVAGSRDSQRARDEARAELGESSRMNREHPRGDLYRPN